MSLTLTEADAFLKQYYDDQMVEELIYTDNPLHAMLPKREDFQGKAFPLPVLVSSPQGRSKTFSTALSESDSASGNYQDFLLTRARDYQVFSIGNEVIEASSSNKGAFAEAMEIEVEAAMNEISRSLAINEYRTSAIYRAQVLAEPAETATTFTLSCANATDISNFEIGQTLVIYSAASGGSQRSSDGTLTSFPIAAVNRSGNVLTLTGTYNSSGTIAANDFIFVAGDRGLGLSGLLDWIPDSAPTSGDSFFGVNRSIDTDRLAGVRVNATTLPIEEALINASYQVIQVSTVAPTHFFMHSVYYAQLLNALGSKVQYIDMNITAQVGFRGIQIQGPKGPITCISDINCPSKRIFGLRLQDWILASLNKAVHFFETDGLRVIRNPSQDGITGRLVSYAQLGCKRPGANVNITVA